MARRQRSAAELGPAVPRWVVEYQPGRWANVGKWRTAVTRWAKTNLHQAGEFGAWIDVIANSHSVAGAQRHWRGHGSVSS